MEKAIFILSFRSRFRCRTKLSVRVAEYSWAKPKVLLLDKIRNTLLHYYFLLALIYKLQCKYIHAQYYLSIFQLWYIKIKNLKSLNWSLCQENFHAILLSSHLYVILSWCKCSHSMKTSKACHKWSTESDCILLDIILIKCLHCKKLNLIDFN